MRAPISVIIPTLNDQDSLPACLGALMEGLEAGLIRELIVSDGGSSDATGALAQAWGAEVLQGVAPLGAQLCRGCAQAKGAWLLVLHPETVLMPGWTTAVGNHLQISDKAGWFRQVSGRKGPTTAISAGWARLRSRCGLPLGEQGLLIPAPLYARVGGYQAIPAQEDIAMVRALRGSLVALDASVQLWSGRSGKTGRQPRSRNLWTLLRHLAAHRRQ